MKRNKLNAIALKGFFDESNDLSNPNRNSSTRTIVATLGAIIAFVFLISCVSVFFTHNTQTVFYCLIAIILQRSIQGTIEYNYGMKATAMNTYLWAIGAIIFGLILFPVQ